MKLALCIGLNYANTANELNGCIPDATRMKSFLEKNGFNVDMLTDDKKVINVDCILSSVNDLVKKVNGSHQNSKVVIHYSGHGSSIPDRNGDEVDGKDEVVYIGGKSCDSITYITDDTLLLLVSKFKKGTRVFCMFDSCHSGSILDLKYKNGIIDNRRCTVQNDIVCISGCKDSETSTDVTFANGSAGGVLTDAFLDTFRLDFELLKFVNILRWKTKKYNQYPEYTHSIQTKYKLDHFF